MDYCLFFACIPNSNPILIHMWSNSILPGKKPNLSPTSLILLLTLFLLNNLFYYVPKIENVRTVVYLTIYPWYIIIFIVIVATVFVDFVVFFFMIQEVLSSGELSLRICVRVVFALYLFLAPSAIFVSMLAKKNGNKRGSTQFHPFPACNC